MPEERINRRRRCDVMGDGEMCGGEGGEAASPVVHETVLTSAARLCECDRKAGKDTVDFFFSHHTNTLVVFD